MKTPEEMQSRQSGKTSNVDKRVKCLIRALDEFEATHSEDEIRRFYNGLTREQVITMAKTPVW